MLFFLYFEKNVFIIEMEEKKNFTEETQSGFVKGITEAFDIFVSTFKKNGLAVVTFILVLFMILYSFILHPIDINSIVMKALEKNEQMIEKMQEENIQQRLKADKLVMDIMTTLTEDYGVDRCMLFEMHNTTQNLSGVDFLYMTCSYEMLNPEDGEIEYIADNFQKQFLTNFIGQDTYNQLKHKDYLYFTNLENYHRSNYRFINKIKKFDAKSLMLVPFVAKNRPLILLAIISNTNELDAPKIYSYVKTFRTQIEENLMNITE